MSRYLILLAKSIQFELFLTAAPTIKLSETHLKLKKMGNLVLKAEIGGQPFPEVLWNHNDEIL